MEPIEEKLVDKEVILCVKSFSLEHFHRKRFLILVEGRTEGAKQRFLIVLKYLEIVGVPFTWSNGRRGQNVIDMWLDRTVCNVEFLDC